MKLFGSVDNSIDASDFAFFGGLPFDRNWYYSFPTLSQNPDASDWNEEAQQDPTIRTKAEAGYVITRPRFTRVLKKYEFSYRLLSNTDKETLGDFEQEVNYGAAQFRWTYPIDGTTIYMARLSEPIKYKLENTLQNQWCVKIVLEATNEIGS